MKNEALPNQVDIDNQFSSARHIFLTLPDLNSDQAARLEQRLRDLDTHDPMDVRRRMQDHHFHLKSNMISREDLRAMALLQNIFYDPCFTSHRKWIGPGIVFAKKLLYRFFKKWLTIVLARQFELNQRVFNLAMTVHILENRVQSLENTKGRP